jgi:hypothetical protein
MGWMPKPAPISDVNWVKDKSLFYTGSVETSYRLSLFPRKCRVSKQSLWLKKAYRVRHTHYSYSGIDDSTEDRWYDKKEYFKLRLMG